jgi:Xaa-Pro aminopeptidase
MDTLRGLLAESPALLVSNPVNISYLTGFTGTAGFVLVTGDGAFLLTDFRYLEQAAEQAKGFEIVDVGTSVWARVAELLGADKLAFESEHLTVDAYRKMEKELAGVELVPVASPVAVMRRVKSEKEVAAIEAAIALGDAAFEHILGFMEEGMVEREVALELEFFMRSRGASGTSFSIIVASGARSALPHGVAGDKRLERGDAVVLDLGCVLGGYCSDLSRTVFMGDVGEEARQVYNDVLAAQQRALLGLRAGLTGKEADALARELLNGRGFEKNFGHGLGHGLGREIHESPRLSPASEEVLAEGMVVTVEPGVYLPGKFGVRIEDVVVIGEGGCRNLTGSTKELICL